MAETSYSSWTGLIYIFNLIVGTGALTLPAAFFRSGWALGSILMCILAFVGYVTATFVVEAMATMNAMLNFSKAKQLRRISHYLDTADEISRDLLETEEEVSASEESPLTAPGTVSPSGTSKPKAIPTIPASPSSKPTSNPTIPASTSSKPAANPTIPASTSSKPTANPTIPASTSSKPTGNPTIPASTSLKPTDNNISLKITNSKFFRKLSPLSTTNLRFSQRLSIGSIQNFPSHPATYYSLDTKVEMGEMAALLFSRGGRFAFFLCFASYLYGDLAIYSSVIGHSLVDVICDSNNFTDPGDKVCKPDYSTYSTIDAYRIFLLIFLLLFGPFVFFNVQKTKYIQFATSLSRWTAFGLMIYLTFKRLLDSSLPHNNPRPVVLSGFSSLLSSCVYAFMCHHSLPSLLTPISNKKNLGRSLAADYLLVLSFYLTLAIPAVFAYPQIKDLFTLNFVPQPGDPTETQVVDYFLILFPVFTISASYPIILVTLRNNLQAMVAPSSPKLIRFVILPLAAVIPSVLLAGVFPNLQFLVGITGAYAGIGIQYVIPAALVIVSRRNVPRELTSMENPFASPFRHQAWPLLVILWAIICISCSTVHIISKLVRS